MKKTNIFVLTGFLGAGKTTFLNKLLAYFEAKKQTCTVIMNEIGQMPIDDKLLPDQTNVRTLTNGCLCCQNKEQFENLLVSTIQNEHLDNLIIECSGASHPAEVITDCLNPLISDQINYKGCLAVVNVPQFLTLDEMAPQVKQLILEQLKYADIIIPTKTDLLTAEQLLTWTDYQQSSILQTKISTQTDLAQILTKLQSVTTQTQIAHEHHHSHLNHVTYTFSKPINSIAFENWLTQLPDNIYRIKGFINFSDNPAPKCYLFQYAYGVPLTQAYELKMPFNLVIIGLNLNQNQIIAELKALEQQ